MKKLIQKLLLGYRENKQAKEAQGGSKLTFEGGSPQEKFNALVLLQKSFKAQYN